MSTTDLIGVTAATGKLGEHVIELLLEKVPANQIVAIVRDPNKAAGIAAKGVLVRRADYNDEASLVDALSGVKRLLFISSSEVGARIPQHEKVVRAAKAAKIARLVYTSILHASTSEMKLAVEHKATEAAIRASGLPFVLLRNGWYTENFTESLAPAIAHGVIGGCSKDGKIAAAPRRDYAAAAVAVLLGDGHTGKTYELAGDSAFSKPDLAREVARLSGKNVVYQDLGTDGFEKMLVGVGLPQPYAQVLVDCDLGVARGELEETSGDLHRLIGRATTPLAVTIAAALR
jgi:NAD(P)H dehydrogenase (quinone)